MKRHTLLHLASGAAMLLLSAGCCQSRPCAVRSERADSAATEASAELRVSLWRDSVTVRDSLVTTVRGDTVRIDRWHIRERDRLRVDTVTRTDTVRLERTRTLTIREKTAPPARRWRWAALAAALLTLGAAAYTAFSRRD